MKIEITVQIPKEVYGEWAGCKSALELALITSAKDWFKFHKDRDYLKDGIKVSGKSKNDSGKTLRCREPRF